MSAKGLASSGVIEEAATPWGPRRNPLPLALLGSLNPPGVFGSSQVPACAPLHAAPRPPTRTGMHVQTVPEASRQTHKSLPVTGGRSGHLTAGLGWPPATLRLSPGTERGCPTEDKSPGCPAFGLPAESLRGLSTP